MEPAQSGPFPTWINHEGQDMMPLSTYVYIDVVEELRVTNRRILEVSGGGITTYLALT